MFLQRRNDKTDAHQSARPSHEAGVAANVADADASVRLGRALAPLMRNPPRSSLQPPDVPTNASADGEAAADLGGAILDITDDFAGGLDEQRAVGTVNVLAIGSDRTTGDCLGPLVGEYLQHVPTFNVYGSLSAPVHAANMREIVPEITGFTVAIDAALGDPVGGIAVRSGSIAPGAAFGRDLPRVGNVGISALVCEAGPLGFERLRSVRLGFVRDMAHMIADALCVAVGDALRPAPHPAVDDSRPLTH